MNPEKNVQGDHQAWLALGAGMAPVYDMCAAQSQLRQGKHFTI